jgi:hypothetical protein
VYLNIKEVQTPIQRVAFGSCNDQIEKQPLWPLILKRDPQLWLWTGDNVYSYIDPGRTIHHHSYFSLLFYTDLCRL